MAQHGIVPLWRSNNRQKVPLGQSDATNFVADRFQSNACL